MKAFVYLKNGSRKVQEMTNVISVEEDKENHVIIVRQGSFDSETRLDTKVFKTVIYQN